MKIKHLSLIIASLALIPAAFCGCSMSPDNGGAQDKAPDAKIIAQDNNGNCPDDNCPEGQNGNAGERPDGDCPKEQCPENNGGQNGDGDKPIVQPRGKRRFVPHRLPPDREINKPVPLPFDTFGEDKTPDVLPVPDMPEQTKD